MSKIPDDFMAGDGANIAEPQRPALKVLVSSTVYGKEDFLERVYQLLAGLGYDVRMSYAGTIKVSSGLSAFENCLRAVETCDLFLGIITTGYGSGIDPRSGKSITHMEIDKAIELGKPRWMLVDSRVPFMRNWLKSIGVQGRAERANFMKKLPKNVNIKPKASPFELGKHAFDLRTIDMYETAILDCEESSRITVEARQGNWVQPYSKAKDIERFVVAQFAGNEEAMQFIQESFHGAT